MNIINSFQAETDLYCNFWEQSTWKSPQTLLTMYQSCISGCMWIFQTFGLARPDHRMGGWRWGCHCSSLTIFLRALHSLWDVFPTYFFTLRCSKPKILGKNYRIASQKFFTEMTKGCLWLQFLSAECFDQSIWCLGQRISSARGQKSAPCLSQICAGTPRAGCKEGQAHPHVSSSTSSPLLPVPAQGFPGPEAGFVFLYFIAHPGLFFQLYFWSAGTQCGCVLCVSVWVCFNLFPPLSTSCRVRNKARNILVLPLPHHPGHAVTLELLVLCLVQTKGFPSPESYFYPLCIKAEFLQFSCCKTKVVGAFISILFILWVHLY